MTALLIIIGAGLALGGACWLAVRIGEGIRDGAGK